MKVFISYDDVSDRAVATLLSSALKARGVTVLTDWKTPGGYWGQALTEGMSRRLLKFSGGSSDDYAT